MSAGRRRGGLLDARQSLRRPLTEADVQATPTANAAYTHGEHRKSIGSSGACRIRTW